MKILFCLVPMMLGLVGCTSMMVAPANVSEIEIVDFGIYQNVGGEASEATHVTTTTRVPAAKGVSFGYRFVAKGSPANGRALLTFQDKYPGLKDPDSRRTLDEVEYSIPIDLGKTDMAIFTFEEDWELVPGEWTFSVGQYDTLLAEKTFTVVK